MKLKKIWIQILKDKPNNILVNKLNFIAEVLWNSIQNSSKVNDITFNEEFIVDIILKETEGQRKKILE